MDKAVSEWISMKERLPEFGQWCLVFQRFENGDTQFEVDHYLNDELANNHPEKWAYAENQTVTHWMPLPPPPNLESEIKSEAIEDKS